MRVHRFLLSSGVLLLVALAWNAFIHLFLFRAADASVAHLRRPDFASKAWLSIVLTAGIVTAFLWGYRRCARDGSIREGVRFGVFFAVVAGLLVDLNQYLLYPIPAAVASLWFLGGLVEFCLYGCIASRLYPPAAR